MRRLDGDRLRGAVYSAMRPIGYVLLPLLAVALAWSERIDQLPSCRRFASSTSSCTASTASSISEKPQPSTNTRPLSR